MNKKEVLELKRRLKKDQAKISVITLYVWNKYLSIERRLLCPAVNQEKR